MFELENRGELVEKIEDLVNRKRYTELRDLLLPMEPADIAILADDLDDEKTLPLLFRLLPKEQAAEVFVELESDQQELLIRGFSNTELKEVLDERPAAVKQNFMKKEGLRTSEGGMMIA